MKNCQDVAVRRVLDYLEAWAEFYSYVECNVSSEESLLHRFSIHIHRELSYYTQKYAGYRAFTEITSSLHEEKAMLLGRLVGWERSGLPAPGSDFLILSVCGSPGKTARAHAGTTG